MTKLSWLLSLSLIVGGCASSVGPIQTEQPTTFKASPDEASSESLGQPLTPFELVFDDFRISVPDLAACAATERNVGDRRFTLRVIEEVYVRQQMRPRIPPFAHRPCPNEAEGISVELPPISGAIFVGPGNLLQDNPDGSPIDLSEAAIGADERLLLNDFFQGDIPRPLSGRSPPVLYACDGSICRAAFRHVSSVVTAVWKQRPQPLTPQIVVDDVASHLWAWTKHTRLN